MFLFGGIRIWGLFIWKAMECIQWDSMGHPNKNCFCLCPKSLPETKVKSIILIAMTEKIQKSPAQTLFFHLLS